MPRQKSLVTVIREMVKTEIAQAFHAAAETSSIEEASRTRRAMSLVVSQVTAQSSRGCVPMGPSRTR